MSFIDPQSLARISMTVSGTELTIGVKQPFQCWVPDASNPGSNIEKTITAPAVIKGDGDASENFTMGSMGQTLAVDWLLNFPIFWYWTFFSGTVYWVASRNPCMKVMPAATQIGYLGTAPFGTRAQGDAWVAATITPADFAGLPVWGPIGSMPVQRAANETDVKLVALTAGQDGFGKFQEGVRFTMPELQMGATTNHMIAGAGGTCAIFTTHEMYYYMGVDGFAHVTINYSGDGGGDGAGAVAASWALPLASASDGWSGSFNLVAQSLTGYTGTGRTVGSLFYPLHCAAGTIEWVDYTNGNRIVSGSISYPAF